MLFSAKKFKPELVITHNTGWGSIKEPNVHDIGFNLKDKIYLESGVIINNIIKLPYLNIFYFGFGVGTFYRYGYYMLDDPNDNIALKISLKISYR